MQKFIIGIDTGGTYTDAVLLDIKSGKIVATAKKPTTHYQPAEGIGNTLKELLPDMARSAMPLGRRLSAYPAPHREIRFFASSSSLNGLKPGYENPQCCGYGRQRTA